MVPDVAVVGAGSFGAWTAWHLHQAGLKVALFDAHGPANSRASSGGESRIIRMGYGPREIYTRWSLRSLPLWRTIPSAYDECGALWIGASDNVFLPDNIAVLEKHGVAFDKLGTTDLRRRYPHVHFDDGEWGIFEPQAGALMARRAIQTLVAQLIASGVTYEQRAVRPGEITAGIVIYACGPWLPHLFPELLGKRIIPSRQEVLFFHTPPGDASFTTRYMPSWMDVSNGFYGLPDLESRGFKIANDKRGVAINPETEDRSVPKQVIETGRAYLTKRFPRLATAPLVETRVCQYENTANGDYLLDRHPDHPNVWLAGGGSGHGFKHGPAVGEYLTNLILHHADPDPRFSLVAKPTFDDPAAQSTFYR